MDVITRREVIGPAALVGVVALAGMASSASAAGKRSGALDDKAERERVLACDFTEEEADCWMLLLKAAEKFLELPKLHSMDDHELTHAIHVLQERLLSRPAYRRYKELAEGERK